jgi:hypothetical protein
VATNLFVSDFIAFREIFNEIQNIFPKEGNIGNISKKTREISRQNVFFSKNFSWNFVE